MKVDFRKDDDDFRNKGFDPRLQNAREVFSNKGTKRILDLDKETILTTNGTFIT